MPRSAARCWTSRRSRSPAFSAVRSARNWPRRSVLSFPLASRGPASNTASPVPRSRCMTSTAACAALRRQSTTSPSSSTTARACPREGGVEHRQGPPTRVLAPVKKTIYSLIDLREIMLGCNRRYLAHLAALDDFSAGVRALDRLTKPRTVEQKTVKGINFFDPVDHALLHALQNPRVNIAGVRRADLLPRLCQDNLMARKQ